MYRFRIGEPELPSPRRPLKPANAGGDLVDGGLDDTELHRLAVGELVHRLEGDVEARASVVDGEHVDGVAPVRELPAWAAVRRIPACWRQSGGLVTKVKG